MPRKHKPKKSKKENSNSYKLHGVWVRHKEFGWAGRIAFSTQDKRVWVVWEPRSKGESVWSIKIPTAGSYSAKELSRITSYEPEPWFKDLG